MEHFFADLTQEAVREGSFTSVVELVRAIEAYLAERNRDPRRYQWRASGAAILRKIQKAWQRLNEIQ